ncbi:MAG: bifunctional aspartate kinase/diaminopimelate decarboxylase [Xanthomonadales bacterium]|nr:bifunctional aspartate kinase/diaminopimelate decarboxylase [Xanthomonadales bacterium]
MTSTDSAAPWVVMKFGGTSVADRDCWDTIGVQARRFTSEGQRVLVVVSAVRGVTDALQGAIADPGSAAQALEQVLSRYAKLRQELGLDPSPRQLELEQELSALLDTENSDLGTPPVQARVLGMGELMSSTLGAEYLQAQAGDTAWLDARDLLVAENRPGTARASYLSATCDCTLDPGLSGNLADVAPIHVTQGFIARNADGDTVVLGRGGSDTSAAYLAARLGAQRLEIWTDVPGMFSANPRLIPGARLLRHVSYREAQELSSMGARVLHPRSISPVRDHDIPLVIRWTGRPESEGSEISHMARDFGAQVKAVAHRSGITLIAMEGIAMWHQVGFLADAFALFKKHGFSIDLVSTSEANVTVSLDMAEHLIDEQVLQHLVDDLQAICQVKVIHNCASVSLVGMGIRTILHRLGPALEVFEHRHIYLVSQASNDLNLTFVVDERHAEKLVMQLHQQLIPGGVGGDSVFGDTWEQLHRDHSLEPGMPAWWRTQRDELLELMEGHQAAYVYSRAALAAAADRLRRMQHVNRVFYSMKANSHPEILRLFTGMGLGIECVSMSEVEHVLASVPEIDPGNILFTPNFAPRDEYQRGLEAGVMVTVDNLFVLEQWGEDFAGRDILLRLDPGSGLGHHKLVRTAGTHSKFGIPPADHDAIVQLVGDIGARVIGLHAHVGSGVMAPDAWHRTLSVLTSWIEDFPETRYVDLGGGLGVPDRQDQLPLDLAHLDRGIGEFVGSFGHDIEVWLEPGRYLVAEAGVLLARVTQSKGKGDVRYLGVATGMNSLLRPTLYGAYHEIFNLSRLHEQPTQVSNVVGPICETGDVLGLDRLLPASQEGDVMLIANTGAYGAVMASRYNLREPAAELVID